MGGGFRGLGATVAEGGSHDEVVVADEDEVEARGAIIRAVASIARFMLLGGNCGGYSDLPVPG